MNDPEGSNADGPSGAGGGRPPTPRWVKVFGTLLLVVILLFVLLMVVRGPGGHGPQRHFRGGDSGDTAGEGHRRSGGH